MDSLLFTLNSLAACAAVRSTLGFQRMKGKLKNHDIAPTDGPVSLICKYSNLFARLRIQIAKEQSHQLPQVDYS